MERMFLISQLNVKMFLKILRKIFCILSIAIAFMGYGDTRSSIAGLENEDSNYYDQDVSSLEGNHEVPIAQEMDDYKTNLFEQDDSIPLQENLFIYNPETHGNPDQGLEKYIASLPPGVIFNEHAAFRQYFEDIYLRYFGKPLPKPTKAQLKAIDVKLNMAELKRHNEYRKKHKAPPLIYDQNLAAFAQAYVEILAPQMAANGGMMIHNPNALSYALGELLAGDGPSSMTCDYNNVCNWGEATWKPKYDGHNTDMWYSEIENYKKNGYKPIPVDDEHIDGPQTAHFTQVIFKKTKKIGCGIACYPTTRNDPNVGPNKACIVACNYYKGANTMDAEFEQNVYVPRS